MNQALHKSDQDLNAKTLSLWLYFCAFMVFSMAVIGAITRLTESGLSMVEWRPLIGAIPPLSEAEWVRVFELYKETPEFQKKNFWMGMEEFKTIFFWEWFHRLWGRLIGLCFALPLLYFWIRKQIPEGWKIKLIGLLILGGMQGVMGWVMVQSGLIDRPSVSHYRLAAHLSLAAIIFILLLLAGRSINKASSTPFTFNRFGLASLGIVFITLIWGAFVAGLDAGKIYNHFPMMGDDYWLPQELRFDPLNNHGWVQFTHRLLALCCFLVVGYYAHKIKSWKVGAALLTQIGLGIATILSVVAIPYAAMHQAGAFILLGAIVLSAYTAKEQPNNAVDG